MRAKPYKKPVIESPSGPKIGLVQGLMMVFTAIAFDLLNIIPIVNIIAGIAAWSIFGLWFFLNGINIFRARRLAVVVTSAALSMVPVLSAVLPEITLGIIIMILMNNYGSRAVSFGVQKSS